MSLTTALTETDWVTISSLATAAGTLVLALATFASVRSANRAARVAERAFTLGLRPILAPGRSDDPKQKIMFVDRHWVVLEGGRASAEVVDGVVYLAMPVRNVGQGMAVIEAWLPFPGLTSLDERDLRPEMFRAQGRTLWIPPGDVAFWQGALRDDTDDDHEAMAAAIDAGEVGVHLLYSDHEGGQRTVSQFTLVRLGDEGQWWTTLGRHRPLEEDDMPGSTSAVGWAVHSHLRTRSGGSGRSVGGSANGGGGEGAGATSSGGCPFHPIRRHSGGRPWRPDRRVRCAR